MFLTLFPLMILLIITSKSHITLALFPIIIIVITTAMIYECTCVHICSMLYDLINS